MTNAWNRALTTLLAAGAAGFLLWLAARFDMNETGGYWATMGIVAGCGLLLGLATLRGTGGNPLAMGLLAFLPVLICAAWVLVLMEPHTNWFRSHITAYSGDMGITHAVRQIGEFIAVLAFGVGLVFGLALEPGMIRRRREVVAMDTQAADEPTIAERHEAERAAEADTTRAGEPVAH